jgi:hypothetical protein
MLGVWVISNNAVLGITKIEYGIEDEITVRLNDGPKLKRVVKTDSDGRQYITYGRTARYYLDECMSL